jgi:hypothetical protein
MLWLTSPGPDVSSPTREEVVQEMARLDRLNDTTKIDPIYTPPNSDHFFTEENPDFPSPSPYDTGRYSSYDDDDDSDHPTYILRGSVYGNKPIPLVILEGAAKHANDRKRSLQVRLKMREDRELSARKRVEKITALVGFFVLGVGGWYVITLVLQYSSHPQTKQPTGGGWLRC